VDKSVTWNQLRSGPVLSALGLTAIVLVLILPRAAIDYGASGDALNNALDASALVKSGLWDGAAQARHFPGAPLFEYMLAAIVPWGTHFATNGFVALFYLIGIWLFSLIVQAEPERWLLTVLFAVTPFVIKSAADT